MGALDDLLNEDKNKLPEGSSSLDDLIASLPAVSTEQSPLIGQEAKKTPSADDYSLGSLSSFLSPSNIASGLWEGTKAVVTSPWTIGSAIGDKYAENEFLGSDNPQLQILLKSPGPEGDEARRMVAEANAQRTVVGDVGGAAMDYAQNRGPVGVVRDASMMVPIAGPFIDRAIGDAEFATTGKPTETADQQAERFYAGSAPTALGIAGKLTPWAGKKLGVYDPNTGNAKLPFTRNPSEAGGSSHALGSGDMEGGKGAQVRNYKITDKDYNDVLNAGNGILRAESKDPNLVAVYDPNTTGIKFEPASPEIVGERAGLDPLSRVGDNAERARMSAKAAKTTVIERAKDAPVKIEGDSAIKLQAIEDEAIKLATSPTGEASGVGAETLDVFDNYTQELKSANTVSKAEVVRERLGADLANSARAYETTGRSPWSPEAVAVGQKLYHLLGDAINEGVNVFSKTPAGQGIPVNFIGKTNAIIHTMGEAAKFTNARATTVFNQAESLKPKSNFTPVNKTSILSGMFTRSPETLLESSANRAIRGARGYRQRTGQEPMGKTSRIGGLVGTTAPILAAIPRDLRIVLTQPELVGMKIQQEVGKTDPNAAMQIATDVVQKLKDPNVQEDTKRGIVMGLAIQFPSIFTPAPHGLQSVWRGELLSQPDRRKYMSLVQKSPDTPPDVKAKIISAAVQGQFLDIGTPTVEAGVDPAGFTPNMSLDDIPDPTMGLPPSTMQSNPNPEEVPGMMAGPRTLDMLNRMNINNDYLQ